MGEPTPATDRAWIWRFPKENGGTALAGWLISMGKSLALKWIKIGVPPWIGNPHRDKVFLMTINRAMYLYWLSTWDITFITTIIITV